MLLMTESAKTPPARQVIVIGAGPAGLTAAYQLAKAGVEAVVLEKAGIVGGISRTVNYKGYHFDLGGHRFFTKIESVERMWQEVLGPALLRRNRLSRIYYSGRFFYYPLRPWNAFVGLGPYKSILIIASYLYAQVFPSKTEDTFEQWVSNRFGRHLFTTFFKTYTEKVWGMPCSEIRADWAAQRIKGLSLVSVIKNALLRGSRGDENKHRVIKTLIEQFDYPKFGPGQMWQAVADNVSTNGCRVLLKSELKRILWSDDTIQAVEYAEGPGQKEYRLLRGTDFISSIPLREMVQMLDPPAPAGVKEAASRLRYRDFMTIALIVNQPELFPDNWIYIHDPAVRVGRIQNFKNWSPFMVPDATRTCLGLEYFCFEGDELWNMPDRELIEAAGGELDKLGLARAADIQDGKVVRVPKAYPVYDSDYFAALQVIRQFLDRFKNLQMVGRNGMHRYNNQDHSMLTAMLAVENVLGANHDLWQVNDEQEYHEEIVDKEKQQAILQRLSQSVFGRMDELALAAAVGAVAGFGTLLATLFLLVKGGEIIGPNLQLLGQYFIGYSATPQGALIGAAYSFFWGFLTGWLFAYLRNFFSAYFIYRLKRKLELLTFRDFLDHF